MPESGPVRVASLFEGIWQQFISLHDVVAQPMTQKCRYLYCQLTFATEETGPQSGHPGDQVVMLQLVPQEPGILDALHFGLFPAEMILGVADQGCAAP
jgi:hypothetical protein